MSENFKEVAVEADAPLETPIEEGPTVTATSVPRIRNKGKKSGEQKMSGNSRLKFLEEGATSLLGDDVAVFAAFDQEGSPRLTRTQTRKRKSGLSDSISPSVKKTSGTRGRRRSKKEAEEKVAKEEDEAGEAVEGEEGGENEVGQAVEGDDAKPNDDAAMDLMEKGERRERGENDVEMKEASGGEASGGEDRAEEEKTATGKPSEQDEPGELEEPEEPEELEEPEEAEDGEICDDAD